MTMKRTLQLRTALLVTVLIASEANSPGLPNDDNIVTVSETDLRAAATQKVEPDYPAVARQIRLTGSVDLDIVVDQKGDVEKISIVRGNTLLAGPSLQAIRKWKFKPFENGAGPAKASGPIRFRFEM